MSEKHAKWSHLQQIDRLDDAVASRSELINGPSDELVSCGWVPVHLSARVPSFQPPHFYVSPSSQHSIKMHIVPRTGWGLFSYWQ